MKITEHLRALQDAFMRAHTDDDVRRTGREFGAEMVAQSDRLLAVVEAAEELKVWTVPGDGIRETELASDSFANAALDGLLDAIRALNGETT